MDMDYLESFQNITRQSIPRVDFHLHTSWTDGANTVREMHDQAVREGLEMILFSEHARKTSGKWFGRFVDEVRSLTQQDCQALIGVETKVEDFQGNLDCPHDLLEACDLVMASVHRFPGEKGAVRGFDEVVREEAEETEFQLANAILDNPLVDILAHPFGMCYRRFQVIPSKEKIRALIEKAAKNRIAFEINSTYHPDPWLWIDWCKEQGAWISLGSNAHGVAEVGRIVRILEGREIA